MAPLIKWKGGEADRRNFVPGRRARHAPNVESAGDDRRGAARRGTAGEQVPIRCPTRSTAFYLETISRGISKTLLVDYRDTGKWRGERDERIPVHALLCGYGTRSVDRLRECAQHLLRDRGQHGWRRSLGRGILDAVGLKEEWD